MTFREARIVTLGTLMALCSFGPFYVSPDYLAQLQAADGLSLVQLGYVSGLENFLIAVACTITAAVVGRIGWRMVLGAALVCVAGNLLSVLASDFSAVLLVRAATGLFGEGPLYAMSFAAFGSAANPDRAFGIGFAAIAVGGAVALAAESIVDGLFGPAGILVPYALMALVLAVISVSIREVSAGHNLVRQTDSSTRALAGALLVSIVLWSAAAGAFWTFSVAAAHIVGIPEDGMSRALTIALTVGLLGVFVPIILGNRFGRVVPLTAATAGLILSCFLFFVGKTVSQLAAVLSLVQICWNVAAVYLPAGIAAIDRSGQYSAFCAVSQIVGIALGPALAGQALVRFGYSFFPFAVAGISAGALLLFIEATRHSNRNSVGSTNAA